MRKTSLVSALTATAFLAGASLAAPSALAQDGMAAPQDMPLPSKQYVIDVGVGALVSPKYEGADKMMVSPLPIISFGRFYLPGLGQVSDGEKTTRGFFVFPSINFLGERKASDSVTLTGTKKIDWALELGLGAGFRYDWFSAFVELRQGMNGHTGQVGQVGADIILNPMERLELAFGPRADFASGKYMSTYLGVTAAEAAAALGNQTPDTNGGGVKYGGLSGRARYPVTHTTALHLQAGWDRYIGDARKSPIVRRGHENQFSVGVGVTYRFAFDLFD